MRNRSNEKWNENYEIAVNLINGFDNYDSVEKKQSYAKILRNPIVFDNNVKESKIILNYYIKYENDINYTYDHLIGMSNIVLYIYKSKLYKKWNSVDDFKKTLKALNIQIKIPKSLNNKKNIKNDWLFNMNDIEDCVLWYKKFENIKINEVFDKYDNSIKIKDIWNEWWEEYKNYLK